MAIGVLSSLVFYMMTVTVVIGNTPHQDAGVIRPERCACHYGALLAEG